MLIQKLRLKRGWSQQQLADASGLSVRTIQRIEAGTPADRQGEEAFRYVRKLRGFYVHLFQYVLVNLGLLAINLIFMPQRLWVLWVIGGWGIGRRGRPL